mmetsp:Transcript_28852/g.44856  ORF Transcript_28852/g.44856 Transcript_28852/m.44856 type:complete len:204 (-) Transcript_28852:24-635(-)
MSRSAKVVLSATAVICSAGYFLYMTKKYGAKGAMRMIWEGDYMSEENRDAMDKLEKYSKKMPKIIKNIETVESWFELQKLNSIDSDKASFPISAEIRKKTSNLSYEVDTLASDVDSVLSKDKCEEVVKLKKETSSELANIMSRLDIVMNRLLESEANFIATEEEAKAFYTAAAQSAVRATEAKEYHSKDTTARSSINGYSIIA